MENVWFHDYITPDMVQMHSIREVVYTGRTQFQFVQVIDTRSFGRCLVLDGKLQSAEADEFIYHEALVHPSMVSHPCPEMVFIAGGGEGATLREVLGYRQVKKAIMVDIDRDVIEICRHFLTSFHQDSFDDSRVELHITDVQDYLDRSRQQFDVIVLDLPEPIEHGPADTMHTKEFYGLVATRLAPQGILVLQAGSSSWGNCECFTAIVNTLKVVFQGVPLHHTCAQLWKHVGLYHRLAGVRPPSC